MEHSCVVVDKHEEPGGDQEDDNDEGKVELLEAEQDGEAQEPQDARRLGERVECDRDVLGTEVDDDETGFAVLLLVHNQLVLIASGRALS